MKNKFGILSGKYLKFGFNAFTLAEVLITLGIIGIVAAMTIPTLMNNVNDRENITKMKKYNAAFGQAINRYMSDNNCVGNLKSCDAFSGEGDHALLWQELGPYFNKAKDCYVDKTSDCWKQGLMYKYFNGADYTVMDNLSGARAVFLDGAVVRIYDYTGNCTDNYSKTTDGILSSVCGWFQLDVNGWQKPNVVGRDMFMWHITNQGVYPFGGKDDKYYNDASGEAGCDSTSANISTPPREGRGMGCTAKYILNN